MIALHLSKERMLLSGQVITVDHGVAGFVCSSLLAMFFFFKYSLVGERLIGLWKILLCVAGCLTTPATDAAGQVDQNSHTVLVFFYLM